MHETRAERKNIMAGTRTAPAVTGAATNLQLSVSFIDDSGDTWSESHVLPVGTTNANIEAYLDALQAASGASIYKAGIESVWGTDALADSGNADPAIGFLKSRSVFDSLNVTLKHTTVPDMKNKIVRVPAPLAEMFVNNFIDTTPNPPTYVSDNPDIVSTVLVALLGAIQTLFPAYSIAWSRYSEKTELNEKTRL